METGSNKSLYTLIAVVVFGIFLSLSYFLYQDQLKSVLADVMNKSSVTTSIKLDNNGLIPTPEAFFTSTILADGTCSITNYTGLSKDVIIPATINGVKVTTIGGTAFYNKGLTSLIIPLGITRIENGTSEDVGAFSRNYLTLVTIPDSVTYIGNDAFYGNRVERLYLGDNVKTLALRCFKSNSISEIVFNSKLEVIGDQAFRFNALVNVTIPGSVKTLGHLSFSQNKLVTFTIPSSVTTISEYMLGSNNLTVINIPNSLKANIQANPKLLGKYAPGNLIWTSTEDSLSTWESIARYY